MPIKNKHIFIATGEISGDIQGAHLLRSLQNLLPAETQYSALGGRELKKLSVKIIDDITTENSVGAQENIKFALKRQRSILKNVKKHLKDNTVDLCICIDNQGTNILIGKIAKSLNIKTVFYFPPPVFIYGRWNIKKVKKYFDLVLCPFKEDETLYKKGGVNAIYTGHPFFDLDFSYDKNSIRQKYGLAQEQKVIGVFPGSRFQETSKLTTIFLNICKEMYNNDKSLVFFLSLSHPIFKQYTLQKINEIFPYITVLSDCSKDIMKISDVVLLSSGTATLEGAFLNKPMAICYKISPLSEFIARRLVYVKHIGLPNILAGRTICKEFINKDLTVENVCSYLLDLLDNNDKYKSIKNELTNLILSIKIDKPLTKAATAVKLLLSS